MYLCLYLIDLLSQCRGASSSSSCHILQVILLGDVGAEGASSRTDGISNRPKTAVLSLPGSRQGGNEVAAQDHVTLHVTRPQNDTIFHPGNVIVIFETHGFAASVGTPIKVNTA